MSTEFDSSDKDAAAKAAQDAQVSGDEQVVATDAAPYSEGNPNHVPDPTAVFGTLDTSGTAGGQHERIEMVSPIFEAARAQDLQVAARALDPEDTEVHESLVQTAPVTTIAQGDPDADKARVLDAAAAYKDEPVEIADPSLQAADERAEHVEEVGPEQAAAEAEAEQRGSTAAGSDRVAADAVTGQDEAEADKAQPASKRAAAKKAADKAV